MVIICSLHFSTLLFLLYGLLRYLHSFPTRRSSDLTFHTISLGTYISINLGDGHFVSRSDRKSTRLNSSHRCISYAVFCSKKKIAYKIRGLVLILSLSQIATCSTLFHVMVGCGLLML